MLQMRATALKYDMHAKEVRLAQASTNEDVRQNRRIPGREHSVLAIAATA